MTEINEEFAIIVGFYVDGATCSGEGENKFKSGCTAPTNVHRGKRILPGAAEQGFGTVNPKRWMNPRGSS